MATQRNDSNLTTSTGSLPPAALSSVIETRADATMLLALLTAALQHASDGSTRPHLSSVLLVREDKRLRVVSTDGHRLGMFSGPAITVAGDPLLLRRVDAEALRVLIKQALKSAPKSQRHMVLVHIQAPKAVMVPKAGDLALRGAEVAIAVGALNTKLEASTEEFPPYKQVIPAHARREPEGETCKTIGLDGKYIAEAFEACATVCDCKGATLRLGETNLVPIVVTCNGANDCDALVVVMPMRV